MLVEYFANFVCCAIHVGWRSSCYWFFLISFFVLDFSSLQDHFDVILLFGLSLYIRRQTQRYRNGKNQINSKAKRYLTVDGRLLNSLNPLITTSFEYISFVHNFSASVILMNVRTEFNLLMQVLRDTAINYFVNKY